MVSPWALLAACILVGVLAWTGGYYAATWPLHPETARRQEPSRVLNHKETR